MNRLTLLACSMLMGVLAQAADGVHIKRATLQNRAGASVATADADASGRIRFTQVPPGEYKLVLTSASGRSVTVGDLDGDGVPDLIVQGGVATSGGGAGKVNVQDLSLTKGRTAPPAVAAAGVVSPRDAASGLPTGKRMHKPIACVVGWDGTVKGFASEVEAKSVAQRAPGAAGSCAIKVHCPQPGTVEVLSWSWGMTQSGR